MDRSLLRAGSALWQGLFWLCLVGAATLALMPRPPHLFSLDRFTDKFEHMIAFGVLSALGMLAFPALSRWRLLAWLGVFGLGIEIAQAIPALHRDSDVVDWVVDMSVAALVLGLAALLLPRWRPAR